MRLLGVLVGCAILVGGLSQLEWTVAPGRPEPTLMSALHVCLAGEALLTEENCDAGGVCTRKGRRVEWSRAGARLMAIEGEQERELAQLSPTRLRMLLDDLAVLAPLDTDGGEHPCTVDWFGRDSCARPGPRYRVNASCFGARHDVTLMRSTISERKATAERDCQYQLEQAQRAMCVARAVLRSTIATRKSRRIQKMIEHLEALEP